MGYDPVRDSYQSPTQSSSRESTVTESSSNSRRMHGKLADLLSPTDTVAEATNSVSFFDLDPARAEPLPHPQPSPPSETKKRLYDPKRISAAKDLIRPLKKEDLWINPNLNLLRLPSAAIAQKQQNGNTGGAKRPAEEELPARPQKFAKAQEAITSHYNERRNISIQERKNSPIIGLKNFNNWVKTVLINKFCVNPLEQQAMMDPSAQGLQHTHNSKRTVGKQMLNTSLKRPHAHRNLRVLDMGCGKGGDLQKWGKVGTADYVGFDIAELSIAAARGRYQERSRQLGFSASFHALDCFANSLDDVLSPQERDKPFDVVSMQFCLHYAFENEDKARMMLKNVSEHLRYGGMFVGTIPDSELILERLREIPTEDGPPYTFGNSRYNISFDQKPDVDLTEEGETIIEPFGTKYTFYLQDAVDHVPEYLVPWHHLENLAREYGLELVHFSTFSDLFFHEKDIPEFAQLMKQMRVVNDRGESDMDIDEWEAATIYVAFAFVKN